MEWVWTVILSLPPSSFRVLSLSPSLNFLPVSPSFFALDLCPLCSILLVADSWIECKANSSQFTTTHSHRHTLRLNHR